mmetsp:Transcript_10485/g.31567  ORF Transcript_10485/g.31567 Transcript_10485/m.31567 type:complete len:242 (+) Transcript_10485:325-1050(+)
MLSSLDSASCAESDSSSTSLSAPLCSVWDAAEAEPCPRGSAAASWAAPAPPCDFCMAETSSAGGGSGLAGVSATGGSGPASGGGSQVPQASSLLSSQEGVLGRQVPQASSLSLSQAGAPGDPKPPGGPSRCTVGTAAPKSPGGRSSASRGFFCGGSSSDLAERFTGTPRGDRKLANRCCRLLLLSTSASVSSMIMAAGALPATAGALLAVAGALLVVACALLSTCRELFQAPQLSSSSALS